MGWINRVASGEKLITNYYAKRLGKRSTGRSRRKLNAEN
jgi:predicted Zn-dependent protease